VRVNGNDKRYLRLAQYSEETGSSFFFYILLGASEALIEI
jgi:hypothetical protein